MYRLENDELSISILDPQNDLDRCGSRYCVGGYIYQIEDSTHGPLLTGPQYPNPRPDLFDGQGAPDMFISALGAERTAVGGEVGVIGVGRVRRTSPVEPFGVRMNPEVSEFLPWDVAQTPNSITMQAEHEFDEWSYRLIRSVELQGRTIISRTEISNLGQASLPIRWFPHPFFPPTADDVLCHFSWPVNVPENPNFFMNDEGYICQTEACKTGRGGFQALDYQSGSDPLTIIQRHPLVGEVTTVVDYPVSYLPIWGNDRTFSFEPYFETKLESGEEAGWTVEYRF
jgi:hypothetical protein